MSFKNSLLIHYIKNQAVARFLLCVKTTRKTHTHTHAKGYKADLLTKSWKVFFFHLGRFCRVMLWTAALFILIHNDKQWHFAGALKIHLSGERLSRNCDLVTGDDPQTWLWVSFTAVESCWPFLIFLIELSGPCTSLISVFESACSYPFPSQLDTASRAGWVQPRSRTPRKQLWSPLSLRKT